MATACSSWDTNGNTTDYISMGVEKVTQGLTALTWCGWFKYNGSIPTNGTLDSHGRATSTSFQTVFVGIENGNVEITLSESGYTNARIFRITTAASSLLTADTWYHLAWSWQSVNTNTAYLNGVVQTTATRYSAGTLNNLYNGGGNGVRVLGTLAGSFFNSDCNLSNISIYNRVLSQNEVLAVKDNPESIVDGRITYIPLLNSTVTDMITGNTGTVVGSPAVSLESPPVYYSQGGCS